MLGSSIACGKKTLMPRLQALGRKTKKRYAETLRRAFGDREPAFLPDLSHGARGDTAWPESSRSILRAAIQRYWAEKGDPERGEKLANRIEVVERTTVEKAEPTEAETRRFEKVLERRGEAGEKAAWLCLLAMQSGARSEELLTLNRTTVETALKHGRLELDGKGSKKRLVPVFERTQEVLRRLLKLKANLPHNKSEAAAQYGSTAPAWEQLGQLLASPDSEFQTRYNMLNRYVKDVAREAELNVDTWAPHTLRRIYASRLTRGGAPISVVQKALGHAFVTTTQRYIKVSTEDIGAFGKYV